MFVCTALLFSCTVGVWTSIAKVLLGGVKKIPIPVEQNSRVKCSTGFSLDLLERIYLGVTSLQVYACSCLEASLDLSFSVICPVLHLPEV